MTIEFGPDALADTQQAVRAALPRWDWPATADVALLNVSENATFRIDGAAGGRSAVLRVHRRGYHTAAEIRSELAWIEALRRDAVVDTPEPLRGVDGESLQDIGLPGGGPGRHAVAFAFAAGREPSTGSDLPDAFRALGAITARLHAHARAWTKPPSFTRKTWDVDTMFGPRPFWGDWRAAVGLDAAGRALIGRALDLIRARLHRFGRGPDRFGLVHADLRLANLLADGPHLRVIDFDDCGFCWHGYDFAAAVSFFEHEPVVDALREAWVEGYRAVAHLPREDAAELPVFVAMRRFLLMAWLASHPEVPIARDLGPAYTAGGLEVAERLLSRFG